VLKFIICTFDLPPLETQVASNPSPALVGPMYSLAIVNTASKNKEKADELNKDGVKMGKI
jgi:hypothetical protein